jgi:hypothetical protein
MYFNPAVVCREIDKGIALLIPAAGKVVRPFAGAHRAKLFG